MNFTFNEDLGSPVYEIGRVGENMGCTSIFIGHWNEGATALLELCSNGDIYVKGELCDNRKEIVEAAYEFFCVQAREFLKDGPL